MRQWPQPLFDLLVYGVIAALSWWLRPFFIRFRDTPASQLNQTFYEYWPCIQWALLFQALTVVLGGFLFRRDGGWFLLASFSFWVAFFFVALPVLLVARSHPGLFLKLAVSVIPLLIFSGLYLVELHHAA
jgi:hypothetical protein